MPGVHETVVREGAGVLGKRKQCVPTLPDRNTYPRPKNPIVGWLELQEAGAVAVGGRTS